MVHKKADLSGVSLTSTLASSLQVITLHIPQADDKGGWVICMTTATTGRRKENGLMLTEVKSFVVCMYSGRS